MVVDHVSQFLFEVAARMILRFGHLVAPYCAIPLDYLSDTPWCDTPSPFSERLAIEEHTKYEVEVRYPPPPGVSQRYWRDTL